MFDKKMLPVSKTVVDYALPEGVNGWRRGYSVDQ
jgi:hypothetical protein